MKMKGQDTCRQVPLSPLFILNNPGLRSALPCASGFTGIPYWSPASTEMLVWFLDPCTNYTVTDATYLAGEALTPQTALLPVIPQPVPDGAGVLAVSDYGFAPGSIYVNPDYKSFAATCLTQPLRKDSLYRFDFYAGFGNAGNEFLQAGGELLGPQFSVTTETVGLFGMTDCSAVGNPIPLYSCINRAGWIPLGEVTIKGNLGTWTKSSIQFTAPLDIVAIAIGPGCDTNFSTLPFVGTHDGKNYVANHFSFFLDSLQFYGSYAPPPIANLVSGDSCTTSVVLRMQPATYYTASSLQWYRNDTLISGQQDSLITIPRKNSGTDVYRVQVSNDTLCLVSNAIPVSWTPLPAATSLGNPDTTVCLLDTLILNAYTDSAFNYVWQDGSTHPWYPVTGNGTYTVTISDGCGTVQAQKTVQFVKCDYNVYVPNAFTPNNDGRNDRFNPRFFNPPSQYNLQVFNRGGLEVFSSNNPDNGWDGSFSNNRQPAGAYIWALHFTDRRGKDYSFTGTLLLIR
jgi:gliding motility-associated-like protein